MLEHDTDRGERFIGILEISFMISVLLLLHELECHETT